MRQVRALFDVGAASGLTDGQLLERFVARQGVPSDLAFAALVERHGPMVLRACESILRDGHDAEEAFQATLLILALNARKLWVRDSVGPWLHRVACRVAYRARASAHRCRAAERRAAETRGAETRAVESEELDRDRLRRALDEEIDRLPERFRVVVVLCDVEGRTDEQAARHLGCPVGTVKSRLARGRRRLREQLTRRGVAPAAVIGVAVLPAQRARALAWAGAVDGWATGAVPAPVRGLARGVMTAMRLKNLAVTCGVLLAIGVAATGLSLLSPGASGHQQPAPGETTVRAAPDAPPGPQRPDQAPDAGMGDEFTAEFDLLQLKYEASKERLRDVMRRHGELELSHLLGKRDDAAVAAYEEASKGLAMYRDAMERNVLELGEKIETVKFARRRARR